MIYRQLHIFCKGLGSTKTFDSQFCGQLLQEGILQDDRVEGEGWWAEDGDDGGVTEEHPAG